MPIYEALKKAVKEKVALSDRMQKLTIEIRQEIIGDTMLNKNASSEVAKFKKYIEGS